MGEHRIGISTDEWDVILRLIARVESLEAQRSKIADPEGSSPPTTREERRHYFNMPAAEFIAEFTAFPLAMRKFMRRLILQIELESDEG